MIHLYIKRCSHCELLYFGRTTSDPHTYPGSGVYWKRHLEKHKAQGLTLKVKSFRSQKQCTKAALAFSERYDIVDARHPNGRKVWANHIAENGVDGGSTAGTLSKTSRAKMSAIHKGKHIYHDGVRHYKLLPDDPKIKQLKLQPGRTDDARRNISLAVKGAVRSAETCERIRLSKLGKSPNLSEEQRAHRRFLSGGQNNGMFGKTHTPEVRKRLAVAARKQLAVRNPMDSAEARAKGRAAKLGDKNPAYGKSWFHDDKCNYLLAADDPRCKKFRRGMIRYK